MTVLATNVMDSRSTSEKNVRGGQHVIEYLPKQAEFFASVDKYPNVAYIGGVGSGKTYVLALQALREFAYPNTTGCIVAPSYRMLEDVTRKTFIDVCPKSWIKAIKLSDNIIAGVNGSEILFRSADQPGPLAGLGLSWFGGDEAGLWSEEVWKMLLGRLRKPGGRHKAFIVGNPAGPTHWTYSYFVTLAKEHPDMFKLVQATSYENSFLQQSYTKGMEVSYGKESIYYKRYVLGQFVGAEGAYWSNFIPLLYPAGHLLEQETQVLLSVLDVRRGLRFGKVIDFGFKHPFVCLWYITDGYKIVFFDEYVATQSTILTHVRAINERTLVHNKDLKLPPSTFAWTDHEAQTRCEIENCNDNGTPIGIPCHPAEKIKGGEGVMKSIMFVQSLFDAQRIFLADTMKRTLIEVPSYHAKEDVTVEKPVKEQDDTCDCIRMACMMEIADYKSFGRLVKEDALGADDLLVQQYKRFTPPHSFERN